MLSDNAPEVSINEIEELEILFKNEPNNHELSCRLAALYNNYVVNQWKENPYRYARHKLDKFILSKELAEESLRMLQKAKKLECNDEELTKLIDENIEYVNWALGYHIDWGLDRTLSTSGGIGKLIIPFIVLFIVIWLVSSKDVMGIVVGLSMLAFYTWIKYVPGWKIHNRQYDWDKMKEEAI